MRVQVKFRGVNEERLVLSFAKLLETARMLRNIGVNERERRWCLFYFVNAAENWCLSEVKK